MFTPYIDKILLFLFIFLVISMSMIFIGKFFSIPIYYYIHYILWMFSLFIFFLLLSDFHMNKFLVLKEEVQ